MPSGNSLQMQRHSKHCPWATDGEYYRNHINNVEHLNRRLYEIEIEPIARPYTDYKHADDIYLINDDLYRTQRHIHTQRVFEKERPYYDELKRVSNNLIDNYFTSKNYVEENIPNFKRFYWKGAPVSNPLNYSDEISDIVARREKLRTQKNNDQAIRIPVYPQNIQPAHLQISNNQQKEMQKPYYQQPSSQSPSGSEKASQPIVYASTSRQGQKMKITGQQQKDGQTVLTASRILEYQ